MLAAGAMFLLGAGLTAAGMLWPGLYDIGILVLIVAAVGVVVRLGDWARVLLAARQAHGRDKAASLVGDAQVVREGPCRGGPVPACLDADCCGDGGWRRSR